MWKPVIHMIDDDAEICAEIVDALQSRGFKASWSNRPLSFDGVTEPDIIILDLSMPDQDGFEVIELIGRAGKTPGLIIASGQTGPIVDAARRSAAAVNLPVLGSLEKPFAVRDLLALLERYTHAPRAQPDEDAIVRGLIEDGSLLAKVRTAFQSKHSLGDGRISGYEALIRVDADWPISPERLFSTRVSSALQLELTRRVIEDAADFVKELAHGRTVSVNLPPAILCDDAFFPMLTTLMDRHGIAAPRFVFELTEHDAGRSLDQIAAAASRLAMRGFGISIDDFGRGNTSLDRLLRLPLSEVKIDREIFWAAVEGQVPRAILDGVVRFCADHKLQSTVEGIETEEQLAFARSLNASHGQGYLFERPFFPSHEIARVRAV